MSLNFAKWLQTFQCGSFKELYTRLEVIAKDKHGVDELPFTLSALEHPEDKDQHSKISRIITAMWDNHDKSDEQAKKLIQHLRKNPPKVNYKNPKVPSLFSFTVDADEMMLRRHIFLCGIDLPGSKLNPIGMGYFSDLFIDMFFGNYTEFMEHINSMSTSKLKKELQRREGYCQFSLLFAPIIGRKMVNIDNDEYLTDSMKREFKVMYPGNNENKHLQILEELLKLGADPDAHDYSGNTPLLHALNLVCTKDLEDFVAVLLKYKANPNLEAIDGERSLHYCSMFQKGEPEIMRTIDLLISHNAQPKSLERANEIISALELHDAPVDLVERVGEAMFRERCRKCFLYVNKKCSACGLVYYCSPACQKLDWKSHKVNCRRTTKKNK